jgi:3-oxoacyl-(acyl-carrier-protein) synthase
MFHSPAYINGTGLISPQETADPSRFLPQIREYTDDFLSCIDPDYKEYIPPLAARRMSRLIKMGITSAFMALRDAGYHSSLSTELAEPKQPDAIITGTGLGSVEDTERILNGMSAGETLMNPTPFIQSTYNTISSQVAIQLRCHQYNSTYVHRIFSFETALLDALMQFKEGMAASALVGGIDEITVNHLAITRRAGHWKTGPVHNLSVLQSGTPGALAGEGAAYFLLENRVSPSTYARLLSIDTFYKPGTARQVQNHIREFLLASGFNESRPDAVILGLNGDSLWDPFYSQIAHNVFPGIPWLCYKHLCGEYYTSTGFALWLTANILKRQEVPPALLLNDIKPGRLETVLIYNQDRNINHSLILTGTA